MSHVVSQRPILVVSFCVSGLYVKAEEDGNKGRGDVTFITPGIYPGSRALPTGNRDHLPGDSVVAVTLTGNGFPFWGFSLKSGCDLTSDPDIPRNDGTVIVLTGLVLDTKELNGVKERFTCCADCWIRGAMCILEPAVWCPGYALCVPASGSCDCTFLESDCVPGTDRLKLSA